MRLPGAKASIENSMQLSKNATLTIRAQSESVKQELGQLIAEIEEKIKETQPELERFATVGESNTTSKYKAKLNEIGDKLTHLNLMVSIRVQSTCCFLTSRASSLAA